MAKKIMCLKCNKGMVAIFDGKILTVKRRGVGMIINGNDSDLLLDCPRCGEVNSVSLLKNSEGIVDMQTSGKVEEITFDEILKLSDNKEDQNGEENKQEEGHSEEGGSGGEGNDGSGKPNIGIDIS